MAAYQHIASHRLKYAGPLDLPQLCRLCLAQLVGHSAVPLFVDIVDDAAYGYAGPAPPPQQLAESVLHHIGLDVQTDDGLPAHVCVDCSQRVRDWRRFCYECVAAQAELQRIVDESSSASLAAAAAAETETTARIFLQSVGNALANDEDFCVDEPNAEPSAADEEEDHNDNDDQPSAFGEIIVEFHADVAHEDDDEDNAAENHESSTASAADDNHADNPIASDDRSTAQCDPAAVVRPSPLDRDALPEQCYVCGVVATRMRNHMRRRHPEALPFGCPDCGRPFQTQVGLDRHRTALHPELVAR